MRLGAQLALGLAACPRARAPARFTAETGERENDMLHDVSIDMCPYPSMDNADLMQTGET